MVSPSLSVPTSSLASYKNTTWISSVEHIKSSRMVTNSSRSDSSSLSSPLRTLRPFLHAYSLAARLAAALELLHSFPQSLQEVADSSITQQQLLWRIRQCRCDDVGRSNATLFFPSASFVNSTPFVAWTDRTESQILKPAEKKKTFTYGGSNQGRPVTPPRKSKSKKGGDARAA